METCTDGHSMYNGIATSLRNQARLNIKVWYP